MKSKGMAMFLCCFAFIGIGGLHDFYLGRKGMGIAKLLTIDFFWIGLFFDLKNLHNGTYPNLDDAPSYSSTLDVSDHTDYESENGIIWEEGSEKQIAWAEKLVTGFLDKSREIINDASKNSSITSEEAEKLINALEGYVIYKDDANWWIDNRDLSIRKKMLELIAGDEELEKIIKRVAY